MLDHGADCHSVLQAQAWLLLRAPAATAPQS
jgi:hypothetical protein